MVVDSWASRVESNALHAQAHCVHLVDATAAAAVATDAMGVALYHVGATAAATEAETAAEAIDAARARTVVV